MEEAPAGALYPLARAMGRVVEEHEHRRHVPRAPKDRLTAVPFPEHQLDDVQISRAIELLTIGLSETDVAETFGTPLPALQRALADYQPRWQRFLLERATAG